nr:group II intron reverse transcriptase/maturase [uncultured Sphaerochaeta sp.]
MEVPKQNVKDSQLQLEGLFSEDSPEGEGRKTASVSVRKNPEEGNQPTITSEEESLLTKTLDHIVSLQNMRTAFMKVAGKKGAGGVDGMKTEELTQYLQNNYSMVRQSLLEGTYKPQPVRRVEIPKDNGKTRDLGIPTVIDRGIQMAIVQVLTRIYEPKFSESSFGFRPGRSAHDALEKCIEHAREGYVWVVDMDLEKFFDTVPQSRLLQLVSETIKDGRVISLLYKYLKGGVMVDGIRQETTIGVPQGGPLSPLLSNIMLNESDRELEKRGHRFVRYADDMMILCKSERAALRVMESTTKFLEKKLKLKVNREKTVVRRITNDIKFLGYGFYSSGEVKLKVHLKLKVKSSRT